MVQADAKRDQCIRQEVIRSTVLLAVLVTNVVSSFYWNTRQGTEVVYTHFFYLPIILAGLWYYKKAAVIAIVLGLSHVSAGYLFTGTVSVGTLIRAAMFLVVSLIVGHISERKDRYFEDLKSSIKQHDLVLGAVSEGIVSMDLGGNVVYANPSAARMLGCHPGMVSAKELNLVSMLSENDRDFPELPVLKNISLGEPSPVIEGIMRAINGQKIRVEYKCTPMYERENLIGAVVVLRDITERVRVESELARLDKLNLVGKMAAGLAHELRNPMTTVRGFLQMSAAKDGWVNAEHVGLMIDELDRANSIISEFLSLSRNHVGKFQRQSLNAAVEAVSQLIYADTAKSGKQVGINCGEIPDIYFDAREIRQLILNLVNNALDVTPPGGTVWIATYAQGDGVFLAIQDNGEGIKEEVLEQLGTPFFTTKETGTGLGLAICYSIAQRHKAEISIETGKTGTTFLVKFPKPSTIS